MANIKLRHYRSVAGELVIGSIGGKICMCDWMQSAKHCITLRRISRYLNAGYEDDSTPCISEATAQLDEYFAGIRKEFSIDLHSCGTNFQLRVWEELKKIPYGSTLTYRDIACRINHPKAIRAVASAIASNPLSIFIPCHRVVGLGNRLTGYTGGLEAKRILLDLENPLFGRCKDFP